MATSLVIEDKCEIPMDLQTLADFRSWALSEGFPENGRIDFISGRIEVNMSPEELFSHGNLKVQLVTVLNQLVEDNELGYVFTDSTRISSPDADLSAEPDVVFLSDQTIDSGRARLVPKATGEPGRFVEIEGAADLVVEIVSDSSVRKDTQRLPVAYFRAGVEEFWLVDARINPAEFRVYCRADDAFAPVDANADGFQHSKIFGRGFRLDEKRDSRGIRRFRLTHS
jgi:Uma2 family endonuclease